MKIITAVLAAFILLLPALPTIAQDTPQVTAVQTRAFDVWVAAFRPRALSAGISANTFDRAFRGVALNPRVIQHDQYQPEFNKPIWEYLDTSVADSRVTNGRQNLRAKRNLLRRIERQYGVQAEVLTAIWGIESNYGQNRGSFSVIEALATLAFDGRRRRYGEGQLIAALHVLQNGDTTAARMMGSWAGAMGHTQFIPTSYQAYAVDWTGNGRRDIWAENPADALASAANYLNEHGWHSGDPWGVEIVLPDGFDYALVDVKNKQPVSYWNRLGVRTAQGGRLPNHGAAALLLPAGGDDPVFAIYHNFNVILRYNNAVSYALSIGHLSDRIAGGTPFVTPWSRNSFSLTQTQIAELQTLLTSKGFSTNGVDGVAGANTRSAIIAYQRSAGLTADGFASTALLEALR
ncbi:MAG: lytic murein transglycosylase [Rhodobacteraceae bacterium]|nr:lytic murein transglycosylase [Paracoccaceae bacterium]